MFSESIKDGPLTAELSPYNSPTLLEESPLITLGGNGNLILNQNPALYQSKLLHVAGKTNTLPKNGNPVDNHE